MNAIANDIDSNCHPDQIRYMANLTFTFRETFVHRTVPHPSWPISNYIMEMVIADLL